MDTFLRLMELNGVSVTASQASLLSSAYSNRIDERLCRNIDELPLVWRASSSGSGGCCQPKDARRVLFGLLELAHCARLAQRLEALEQVQERISSPNSKGLSDLRLDESQHEQEEIIVQRDYQQALGDFSEQVRNLHSRLILQAGSPAGTASLLCARPTGPLAEAESDLDRALVGLADRLFSSNDPELADEEATSDDSGELNRVRDLHRRVLLERGRLAGGQAALAEQIRRLRAHLDDPERTLSMAKTWLAEAKAASADSLPSALPPDSTTLDSAASAAASILAGQEEQRRLDRRLVSLRRLADRQSRLLNLLQRRRALHDRLLSGQEAELARLRRLRGLLEAGRRRIADTAGAAVDHQTDVYRLDEFSDNVEDGRARLSTYLDRLSRLKARLDDSNVENFSNDNLSTLGSIVEATDNAVKLVADLLSETESALTVEGASSCRQRLNQLNSQLIQVKQRWAAAHSSTTASNTTNK